MSDNTLTSKQTTFLAKVVCTHCGRSAVEHVGGTMMCAADEPSGRCTCEHGIPNDRDCAVHGAQLRKEDGASEPPSDRHRLELRLAFDKWMATRDPQALSEIAMLINAVCGATVTKSAVLERACPNCDAAMPDGCEGMFKDEGPACWHNWWHLKPFGYAPGKYTLKCPHCKTHVFNVDKRARACMPCATALYESQQREAGEMSEQRFGCAMKGCANTVEIMGRVCASHEKEAAHAESICERCDKPLSTHSLPLNRCADGERGIF